MEVFTHTPGNAMLHLASLITEGVFERLEGLCFVFADGGFDVCSALMWRLDKDWKATRSDVPWARRMPSEYLGEHVRFVFTRWDGTEQDGLTALADVWDGSRLLLYGSNFPFWDELDPEEASARLPNAWREAVLGSTARRLYKLDQRRGQAHAQL
jgi:predicted TIM-barrel fold metal-dependent hydrolase